jgi:Uma2 family endonuclease
MAPTSLQGRVKRWTVAEVDRMVALGAIERPERYELIEGAIVEKTSRNEPHWYGVTRPTRALRHVFGLDQDIVNQHPLKMLKESAPEPDVLVFTGRAIHRPRPEDVALVVEVSDTSLREDQGVKARIYARAGVRDYWVLDLVGRRLFVHRGPGPDGSWGSVVAFGEEETVRSRFAEGEVRIGDLLPTRDQAVPSNSL